MNLSKFKFCPYKIHWYEGMPLSPHHFQQSDITNQQTLSYILSKSMPNAWGVVDIDIDLSNISQNIITLNYLEAILPDRSIMFFPMNKEEPMQIKIDEQSITNTPMPIFITKPNSYQTYESDSSAQGYEPIQLDSISDNNNGENSACVFKLKPKYEIHFGQIPFNHTGIQICSIIDSTGGLKAYNYDRACLDSQHATNIIKETKKLISLLKNKTVHIKNQINIHNQKYNPSTINSIFLQGILPVDHMIHSKGVHPHTLFSALITLIAHISIFNPDIIFQDIPIYQHEHLLKSFNPLFKFIQNIFDNIKEPYVLHDFDNKDSIFFIETENNRSSEIFILISYDETADLSEMSKWVDDCIISSESMLNTAVETRVLGIKREYVGEKYKQTLSDKQMIVKIDKNDRFFLPEEKLFIYNPVSSYSPISVSLIEFVE